MRTKQEGITTLPQDPLGASEQSGQQWDGTEGKEDQSDVARGFWLLLSKAMRGSWDPWDCSHGDAMVSSGLVSEPDPRLSQASQEPREG